MSSTATFATYLPPFHMPPCKKQRIESTTTNVPPRTTRATTQAARNSFGFDSDAARAWQMSRKLGRRLESKVDRTSVLYSTIQCRTFNVQGVAAKPPKWTITPSPYSPHDPDIQAFWRTSMPLERGCTRGRTSRRALASRGGYTHRVWINCKALCYIQ